MVNKTVLLAGLLAALAFAATAERPDPQALVGEWKVDLRPTPDAEPYYTQFVVEEVKGTGFKGTFYGTKIENGRLNRDWGAVYFAFTTRDGGTVYNSAGRLTDGRLEGTTNAVERAFLSVWTAERVGDARQDD